MHLNEHSQLNKIVAVILGVFFLASSILFLPIHVGAASYTWDGGGTDGTCGGAVGDGNKWSCAANWSSDIVPLSTDTVTFNATSTKNAVIDASFQGTVASFTISAGYTGTITLQRSLTSSGAFSQSDGTFNGSNQTINFNSTFTLNSGGTFTASSGTITSSNNNFTINSGATFNHNNGTITFAGNINNPVISCGNKTFNLITFTHSGGTRTVGSDCTLPLGNNPVLGSGSGSVTTNGTLSGTGTITSPSTLLLGATGSLSGFTGVSASIVSYSGGSWGTVSSIVASNTFSSAANFDANNFLTFTPTNITVTGGIFTSTPTLTITGLTLNSGSTFIAPSGNLNLSSGNLTINSGATYTHNNGTLNITGNINNPTTACNNATFNAVTITHTGGTRTVGADCTFPVGNNPTLGNSVSASLTVNGTLTGTGTITNSATFTLGASASLSGFSAISGSSFTYNGGSLGTISSITMTGTTTTSANFNANNFSIFSPGSITVSGGTFTSPPTLTVVSLILNSGGTFIAPSGNLNISNGNLTINSGSTFTHSNGTLNITGSINNTIMSCNNATFNVVTITHTGGSRTVNANCTFPNTTINAVGGSLTNQGNITGTGTATLAALTLSSGSTYSGFTGLNTTSTVTVATTLNGSAYTIFRTGTLTVNSGGNVSLPPVGGSVTGAFNMTAGSTFTASSGTTILSNNVSMTGGTFNHNNGLVTFNSGVTLICNNAVFNLTRIGGNAGALLVISSNCTLPLEPNAILPTSINLQGTLTGTGTLESNGNSFTLAPTGSITGFDSFTVNGLIHNGGSMPQVTTFLNDTGTLTLNGTWNASNITNFTAAGNTSINSAANFTAPAGTARFDANLVINSGATFTHNNGTITLGGTTAGGLNCGNKTFNIFTFTHTAANKSIGSDCSLPLGTDPSLPDGTGGIVLSGTITGSGTFSGYFLQMQSGSNVNCFDLDFDIFVYMGGTICGGTAPINWDGGGTDSTCGGAAGDGNKWSCALNWSTDTVPGTFDPVIFDTTSTKNSVVDANFLGEVLSITMAAGYTGTLTQQRSIFMYGSFTQSDGVFQGSDDALYLYGEFTLNSPAIFNAPSDTLTAWNQFVINSGATFNGNSGNIDLLGRFILNSGAIFTSTSGRLSVRTDFTINSGVTFNHNNGTVNFNSDSQTAIITCNNALFNFVTFKYLGDPASSSFTRTVSANCTLPLGNDPIVEAPITLSTGTLTGTGTFYTGYLLNMANGSGFTGFNAIDSVQGPTSNSTGASLTISTSKNFNAGSFTHITLDGAFIMLASSTFTAPPIFNIGRGFNINASATYNHNNGTVTFTDPINNPDQFGFVIICNATNFYNVVLNHTTTVRNVRGINTSTTCVLPLGNNPTVQGPLGIGVSGNLPGTLVGTGTITFNNAINHNLTGTISGFNEAIFNNTYTNFNGSPTFTNVNKATFNDVVTFANTYNGNQLPEMVFNDDLIINVNFTFTAPALMKVAGNFTNDGTFAHSSGTVEFFGSGEKVISGNNTFHNLKVDSADSPTLSFTSGSTQTVLGLLTLKGQPGELIYLESTTPGDEWNIDVQGTYDIEYVNVSDSTALTTTLIVGCDSFDAGGNTNWEFGENCSPTVFNLGPEETVSGGSVDSKQPTFTFSISDPNPLDLVQYTIEIDNNSDFSSPEVCYTSAFVTPGSFSFTVGQPAGDGTYSCGSEGQTLADGTYYWRIVAVDSSGYSSGYKVANGGDVAFKVIASLGTDVDSYDPFNVKPDLPEIIDPTLPETGSDPEIDLNDVGDFETPIKFWHLIVCFSPVFVIIGIMMIPIIKPRKKKYHHNVNRPVILKNP